MRALWACAVTLTLLATAALACDAPSGFQTAEDQLISYTNDLRSARGTAPVVADDQLQEAAQKHACFMARTRKMSHTGDGGSSVSDRVDAEGYRWRFVAENVAYGYRSAQSVGEGWRGSRGHRRNMLNAKATQIGIGWAQAGGRDYWVMVLAAPR